MRLSICALPAATGGVPAFTSITRGLAAGGAIAVGAAGAAGGTSAGGLISGAGIALLPAGVGAASGVITAAAVTTGLAAGGAEDVDAGDVATGGGLVAGARLTGADLLAGTLARSSASRETGASPRYFAPSPLACGGRSTFAAGARGAITCQTTTAATTALQATTHGHRAGFSLCGSTRTWLGSGPRSCAEARRFSRSCNI